MALSRPAPDRASGSPVTHPSFAMRLILNDELARQKFPEIGRPYRLFRDPGGRFIAVCSQAPYIGWSGYPAPEGQGLQQRVSLYHPDSFERIATLDCRYPVNDLSSHPDKLQIAIASGSYDGGYYFDGELLLWDWETGATHQLVLREAMRCRFELDNSLTVLLRPEHEEQFEDRDAWDTYLGMILKDPGDADPLHSGDLEHLGPIDPAEWGFELQPQTYPIMLPPGDLEELKSMGFVERQLIWDLLWLDDRTFAAVHQNCHLEIHDMQKGGVASFSGDGYGVELLPRPEGGCLVNVLLRPHPRMFSEDKSSLHLWDGHKFSLFRNFDHAYSFSTDQTGNILARGVNFGKRREGAALDAILDPAGQTIHESNLGAFDSNNHGIRLNQGNSLYFLRGTPEDSGWDKDLCTVHADGTTHALFNWDDGVHHLACSLAGFVSDQELIRGCRVYQFGRRRVESRIERLEIRRGKPSWITPMAGSITALSASKELEIVAYSKVDGMLGLLSLETGEILFEERLVFDGIPTISTALAIRGNMLLAGTHDGRLLKYHIIPPV